MAQISQREAQEIVQRARVRDARLRQERRNFERALVRKTGVTLTAGVYGPMTRLGVPNVIMGFPWKLGTFVGATLVEALSSGYVQAFAAGVSDSTLAIYMDRSIVNKTLISGEGEVAGEGVQQGDLAA